jgi:hypothetical protein
MRHPKVKTIAALKWPVMDLIDQIQVRGALERLEENK